MSSPECSRCLSVLEDQVTPSAALVFQQFSLGMPFSSIAFKRKIPFFRGPNILEEPSPVKVDSHRCHILDTKVDLYLAPCLYAYFLEELL